MSAVCRYIYSILFVDVLIVSDENTLNHASGPKSVLSIMHRVCISHRFDIDHLGGIYILMVDQLDSQFRSFECDDLKIVQLDNQF